MNVSTSDKSKLFDRRIDKDPNQRLMTIAEIMAWIKVSRGAVTTNMGRAGIMPIRPKYGRLIRYRERDVRSVFGLL